MCTDFKASLHIALRYVLRRGESESGKTCLNSCTKLTSVGALPLYSEVEGRVYTNVPPVFISLVLPTYVCAYLKKRLLLL